MADHHLTVTSPFGKYARGAHIEDDAEVTAILNGENRHCVVKVAADKKPEPEAKPAAAKTAAPRA